MQIKQEASGGVRLPDPMEMIRRKMRMRNMKRWLAALLAVVMVLPSLLVPGFAAGSGFEDVPENSWYASAVEYVNEKGYMTGVGNDKFAPDTEVTRAMFVTVLSRLAMVQTDGLTSDFADVESGKWYTGAIAWAAENGIVNGVGGGRFAPTKAISRQDLCTILYRFVNTMGYKLTATQDVSFTDASSVSAYASDAVRFAASVGLVAGYSDGSFHPKDTATRAQTAVIVMRLAQLLDGQIVKPEPMPAQSFNQTADQMKVSVTAPEGALPENTEMTVSRVTDEAALAELASKVGAEVLGAADISFAKDGAELEPARKVSVRISLDALKTAKNPAVVHIKDDGSFEYVSSSVVTTRGKTAEIEFEADSFSVYAVVGGEGGSHTLTITFYARENGSTGAWKPVNKQIIRADQLGAGKSAIADPGVPNITTSQAFEGWIYGENTFNPDYTYTADTTTYSVKDINDYHNEHPLTANTEIVCYAAVYDVVYVTYHDQAGAIFWAEYAKKSGGSVEKMINVPYNPFRDNQHWAGWVPASYVTRVGDVNGSMPTYADGADAAKWTDGSTHTISANIDLYPYLEEGYWLYFDSNKSANNTANGFDDPTSADYTPPVFVAHGKNTEAPTVPTRAGYTFAGWYTDKNMTTPFTFGSALTAETVLYAKWTPTNSSYLVVFKVQDADNAYDNDVSNNTYSYYAAVRRDWTWNSGKQVVKTGDTVSAFTAGSGQNDAYLSTGDLTNTTYYPTSITALGVYYQYSTKNNGVSQKVLGNGSTVLEVYYDRVPITFKFVKSYTTVATFTELYGHEFKKADWPDPGSGYSWYTESSDYFHDYDDPMTVFIPPLGSNTNATTVTFNAKTRSVSSSMIDYHIVYQDPDTLSWDVETVDGEMEYGTSLTFQSNDYHLTQGYNTSRNSTLSTRGFVSNTGLMKFVYSNTSYSGYVSVSSEYWVYYTPHPYTVTYVSYTSAGKKDVDSLYGKHLKNIEQYVPTDGPAGSYFVGWYHDQSYQNPVDWENDTTPGENSTLYAKWEPMRFRVVCDPTDCGSNTDVSFSGNQTTMFVLNYGDTVDSIGLNSARSEGKILLGWYLDPECTKPYSFETHLTPNTEGMDMTYADSTSRTWTDPWDGGKTVTDGENVRGILRLYAKWRVDPEGVVGIKVRYLGDHAENDKGYFDSTGKPHEVTMDQVYTDQALAAAHSASVPSRPDADTKDEGRRFLYWEILDKNGHPTGEIVYPGAPFTIDINKAVEIKTPLPDPNCTHTNEGASTIEAVAAVDPTCTETGVAAHYKCTKCGRLFTDAAGTKETTLSALTVSATGHDWKTNDPTYEWSVTDFDEHTVPTCTATLVCGNNETHKLTETVNGQLIVNGTTGYYLAEFEDEHFENRQSSTFTVSRIAVTFKANGETIDELTQLVTSGQTVTLPGSEYLPAFTGYTFVGWVQAAVSDTTTAPAYKAPGETSDPINAPTTFIALYTREQATGGNTTVYQRVTEAPEDWTGNYVLTYLNTTSLYALAPVTGGSTYEESNTAAAYASTGMRLENDKLYDVAQTYVFKFASQTNGYSMQSASNNTYVGRYVTTTENSAKLQSYSSYRGAYCRWTFDLQSGGNVRIQNVYSTNYDTNYPYIGFSSSTANSLYYCFWVDGLGESSTSNAALNMYLWKETTETATQTHYTTTISTYTVTYSVPNGVEQPDPETVVQGDSITLPTAPEGTPEGYTFLGWTTAQTGNVTTQPATLTGEYTPAGSVTLHALYSYVEGNGGGVEYNLVTAAPADWSGSYVITYGTDSSLYALTGVSGSAAGTDIENTANATAFANTGMTLNGTKLTNVGNAYLFTLAPSGNYYSVKSVSANSYLGQTTSYFLGAYNTLNTTYCLWTPGYYTDNASSLYNANGNTSYPLLSFYPGDSQQYFWAGSTANQAENAQKVRFWKETPLGTTYYTTQIGSSGGNAVTQPNLSSDKADSSAHLINLSANANPNPVTATTTNTLLSEGFESGTFTSRTSSTQTLSTTGWTAYTAGGNNWTRENDTYYGSNHTSSGRYYARYMYHSSNAADAYLISKPFTVSGNAINLEVSLWERVYNSSYEEKFEVFFVKADGLTTTGGVVNATHYSALLSGSYTNTTYANRIGYVSNVPAALAGESVRLVVHCTSAANQYYLSVDDITVTEITDDTAGTVTYQLATNPQAGKDYIIAIDNHVVANTVKENNRYLAMHEVTVNADNTITLPANIESSVLWRVGGSSSGWTFYNQSAGKYMGLNADDSHWLSMTSSAWNWLYDGTDLDNQCTTSDNANSAGTAYYRYLSYSATYEDFTTSTATGQNVKFYEPVSAATTYTVTVASGITNGTVSADKETAAEGDLITLSVAPADNYEIGTVTYTPDGGSAVTITPVNGVYSFTMPASNVTVSATFTASATPEPGITTIERWVPVDNIVTGEDYLIGFVYDGNTYLGLNTTDYYSYRMPYTTTSGSTATSSTYSFMGYTGTPVFDGENIVGITGNATDLAKATWKFTSVTGGYNIVSGASTSNYLHANARTSSSPYWDQYVSTDVEVWTWDGTHLYNSTNSVYAGMYTSSDLSDVYMCCDTDETSTAISVQLYKKEIVNVYNVTVNPTENGTVRANKSTATADETVTLFLSPSDGYEVDTVTVTASDGTQIEVPGANGRFHFTMPAANVTVTATFKKVVADNLWVVSFVDEDGRDIPGMNDIYVPKDTPENLPESALPDPAKEDYYFLGWYQGNVKCTFPMTVNSDIVLTPKYSPMYAYDYTITLRAVYGPFNPDATTHIYWYANNGTDYHNGAGERYASQITVTEDGMTTTTTKLPINAQVDIPLPTGNAASQTVFVGDNGGALTWEDHIFLGWARVDNGGSADYAEAQVLTAENLYLKWTGSGYQVRNDDGTYSPFTSQKVYADETTPYHDMYAVWTGFYYVFHSSTGKLEAFEVPTRDTADLTSLIDGSKYLYGGYYSEYGGVKPVSAAEMRTVKDNILNGENFWDYTTNAVKVNGTTSATVSGAVTYDASAIRLTYTDPETNVAGQSARFWSSGNACRENGTAVTPVVGTVYYLKEVPQAYLPARMLTIRHTGDNTGEDSGSEPIEALYLLTSVDDTNYKDFGCLYGTSKNPTQFESYYSFSKAFITLYKTYENGTEVIRKKEYYACDLSSIPANDARTNGYVVSYQIDVQNAFVTPAWITLDGVTVSQNPYQVNIDTSNNTVSWNPAP